jgi:hypothetical protein
VRKISIGLHKSEISQNSTDIPSKGGRGGNGASSRALGSVSEVTPL